VAVTVGAAGTGAARHGDGPVRLDPGQCHGHVDRSPVGTVQDRDPLHRPAGTINQPHVAVLGQPGINRPSVPALERAIPYNVRAGCLASRSDALLAIALQMVARSLRLGEVAKREDATASAALLHRSWWVHDGATNHTFPAGVKTSADAKNDSISWGPVADRSSGHEIRQPQRISRSSDRAIDSGGLAERYLSIATR
jgi:hypothetical protein